MQILDNSFLICLKFASAIFSELNHSKELRFSAEPNDYLKCWDNQTNILRR